MQADLRGKLTPEIEVRSCGDRFFKVFARNPDHLANIAPSEILGCNVREGEFGKNGTVAVWNYVHDGKASATKVIMENVDFEQRKITFRAVEGDILINYDLKSISITLQVTPKGDNLCLVKWTIEYEKLNEDVPDPTSYADLLVTVTKNVEANLKD